MADLAIATATLSLDPPGAGAAVLYDAIDVSINYAREGLQTSPMNASVMGAFEGEGSWNGTFSVLYDDTTGSPSANLALYAPSKFTLIWEMTDQTHTTPVVVTETGEIVITDSTVNFNRTEVPTIELTFLGDGPITQTQV